MSKDYKITRPQADFYKSTARHTAFVGGYGSGKTFVGTLKAFAKKLQYPNIDVAYYLPTYPLIRDIAFPNFQRLFEDSNIPYTLNETKKEFVSDFGRIILRSMDNHELIVGYEVGYSLIDEADVLPQKKMTDAFVKIVARNRKKLPDGNDNSTDFVSTPEGFGFLYNFFVKNTTSDRVLVKGSTSQNKHLPTSYIETLKEIYSESQLEAYLEGEFVNLESGTVYRQFIRERNHSNRTIQPIDILHIGMDFNITNMSASIRVTDGDVSTAVGEITKAYDTAEIIQIIKERYPSHKVLIYPDASGNARNTAGESDINLLKKAGFQIRVSSKNPMVRDRVTVVNSSFLNSLGETKNFVNTNLCPELTEAYEQLAYKNGQPDKTSGFDHITDADGYVSFYLHEKKKPKFTVDVF